MIQGQKQYPHSDLGAAPPLHQIGVETCDRENMLQGTKKRSLEQGRGSDDAEGAASEPGPQKSQKRPHTERFSASLRSILHVQPMPSGPKADLATRFKMAQPSSSFKSKTGDTEAPPAKPPSAARSAELEMLSRSLQVATKHGGQLLGDRSWMALVHLF